MSERAQAISCPRAAVPEEPPPSPVALGTPETLRGERGRELLKWTA